MDMATMNEGTEPTCIRSNGTSIVDLTMASHGAARKITEWRVRGELESLSDHVYVTYRYGGNKLQEYGSQPTPPCFPMWKLHQFDQDIFTAALVIPEWDIGNEDEEDIGVRSNQNEVEWHVRDVTDRVTYAADATMSRKQAHASLSDAYWWSEGLEVKRKKCRHLRRNLKYAKKKKYPANNIAKREMEYRNAKNDMRVAIRKAKKAMWGSLITEIDGDPWGRPYTLVMSKLKRKNYNNIMNMPTDELNRAIATLFPEKMGNTTSSRWVMEVTAVHREISNEEIEAAIKKAKKGKAPGPDGIGVALWAVAHKIIPHRIKRCLNKCMEKGIFPERWKRARLALIPKKSGMPQEYAGYRPLCMIDDLAKILDRIITKRMEQHITSRGGMSPSQYGFRPGLSIDAINALRAEVQFHTENNRKSVVGAGLDIANAFGSLPWSQIISAMERWRFPQYIQKIMCSYLQNRRVCVPRRSGDIQEFGVYCGVPQGSVLGPLLWNLAYNEVLRTALPVGCSLFCYADDTMIVAAGDTPEEACSLAEEAVKTVIEKVHSIGLNIAPAKTEAIAFVPKRKAWPKGLSLKIGEHRIQIEKKLKYLGVIIDANWHFREHAKYVSEKASRTTQALARLMPNVRGPGRVPRALYRAVAQSVMLYAVPAWVGIFNKPTAHWRCMVLAQRKSNIKVVMGYRTISSIAAGLLAGAAPIDIIARAHTNMYNWKKQIQREQWTQEWGPDEIEQRRDEEIYEKWEERISLNQGKNEDTTTSRRLREAFEGHIREWTERRHGGMDFWTTQILTGHGYFGEYIHKMGKSPTPRCEHCTSEEIDSAEHTLERCTAWNEQRETYKTIAERNNINTRSVIEDMLESKINWKAFKIMCKEIMDAKQKGERNRQKRERERERERERQERREHT